jgi:putative phage-type endonuclease
MRSAAYETVVSADASREEWLLARAGLITASDVPAILGIVPGKPKLWYEKVGLLERGDPAEPEVLEMGHDMEPFCATQYVKKTGRKVRRCQSLLRSKQYPWLGATLDYWTWLPGEKKPGPLEMKATGNKELWPDDGQPAMKFQAQLQTQIIVAGTEWGSLSAIIGSPYIHHRWIDFERDAALCDMILTETQAFAESVQSGTNPPVDGDESTSEALRHLVLNVLAGTTVVLPPEALDWDQELQAAKAAIAQWEQRKRFYENVLMTAIGDHETGELPYDSGRYTFKRQTRAAHSVKESTFRKLSRVAPKRKRVSTLEAA